MLNYLKETLSFLDAVKREPLSPRAQVLWHYLLYFNNRAAIALDNGDYYWPVWFTVDNGVLVKVTGVKSSSRLYNIRRALIDRGWVRYRLSHARGNSRVDSAGDSAPCSQYALTPFMPGYTEHTLKLSGYPTGVPVWVNDGVSVGIVGEESSYIDINNYKYINKIASITAPPTDIAPSTHPNPFDAIAERGRQAALKRVTDEDMEAYMAGKENQ